MFILYLIIIYVILFFIVSRFVVPHLGFKTKEIPDRLPNGMEEKINEIKQTANNDKYKFLKLSYQFLGEKYQSNRVKTITRFNYLYWKLEIVWKHQGFIQCTQSSFVLRIFLIKSDLFKEGEVKRVHQFTNFVPHQYLNVEIDNKWVAVDVGEADRGMPIGKHLGYFSL